MALFHDLGRAECKSFLNYRNEEKRYVNFNGQEFVGAQLAAYHLARMEMDENFVQDAAALVQFHMMILDENEKINRKTKSSLVRGCFKHSGNFISQMDLANN